MRCPPYVFAFIPLLACNRSDPTKDKELAELRARVNQLEGKPSLSAASKPEPSVVPGGLPPMPKEKPTETRKPFVLDINGQLDRIVVETPADDLPDIDSPTYQQDVATLGVNKTLNLYQHEPKYILSFAEKADLNKSITYAHLQKNAQIHAGMPWRFGAKILDITETRHSMEARVSLDYCGQKPLYVFGRFNTPFLRGDSVDVVGYLAGDYSYQSQAGWQITIPAVAAYAMVKYGSIDRVRRLHKDRNGREEKSSTVPAKASRPACPVERAGLDEATTFLDAMGGPGGATSDNAEIEVKMWKSRLAACQEGRAVPAKPAGQ